MLKKISPGDLRVGMHLEGFDGPWLSHPFWRTRFVLQEPADVARVRASGVTGCWIDTAKGLDTATAEVAEVPARAPAPAAAARASSVGAAVAAPGSAARPPSTSAFAEELHRAAAVCKSGRAAVASMFADVRMGRALDAERCLPLVHEISGSVLRNPDALISLARLKTHDDYSYLHSVAVCALMVALARQLGHDDDACRRAGMAGLLHDVGKAVMPPEVLNKPGRLTDVEYAVMRTHPERGAELLAQARRADETALEVCLHHHEKVDGSGYPHGLSGEAVSLLARMGAVCDVYDAITSNRPYKSGWDPAESIARMVSWAGHFDAATLAAFVRSIGIYPTGSLVRMASGRLGVVVEQNPRDPAAPVLRLFYSTRSQLPIAPLRLDLAAGGSDRIVARESPERWGFQHLDDLWLDPAVRKAAR